MIVFFLSCFTLNIRPLSFLLSQIRTIANHQGNYRFELEFLRNSELHPNILFPRSWREQTRQIQEWTFIEKEGNKFLFSTTLLATNSI